MLDCTTGKYDDLYDRWLDKPGALLDWANFDPLQDRLLDLCGGTGVVSKDALRRGAKTVTLLDLNPRTLDPRIKRIRGRAEDLIGDGGKPFNPLACDESHPPPTDRRGLLPEWNLIVCRQAIGYLDLPCVAQRLWSVLPAGGRFVFNTFSRPKWSFKTYRRTSTSWTRRYFEASAYFGKRIFHFQARVGAGFDITSFRWHTHEEIVAAFTAKKRWSLFAFENKGASLRYSFLRLP